MINFRDSFERKFEKCVLPKRQNLQNGRDKISSRILRRQDLQKNFLDGKELR